MATRFRNTNTKLRFNAASPLVQRGSPGFSIQNIRHLRMEGEHLHGSSNKNAPAIPLVHWVRRSEKSLCPTPVTPTSVLSQWVSHIQLSIDFSGGLTQDQPLVASLLFNYVTSPFKPSRSTSNPVIVSTIELGQPWEPLGMHTNTQNGVELCMYVLRAGRRTGWGLPVHLYTGCHTRTL